VKEPPGAIPFHWILKSSKVSTDCDSTNECEVVDKFELEVKALHSTEPDV
jgi:hypothetical protein